MYVLAGFSLIAERYIIREIIRPAIATCAVLIFIFGSYIATRYWSDAAQGELPGITVMLLILLRITIALEVLIPTTLYLSIVASLNRLYRDSEMTALAACGIGMGRVIRAVLIIAAVAAVLVACLSLYIRPWAWDQFFRLKTEAKANFDLTRMKGGTFYELWHGRRVIFAAEVDRGRNLAKQVFIYTDRGDARQVISAREARQFDDEKTGRPILMLFDGNQYEYSVNGINEFMVEFQQSAMVIEPSDTVMEEKVKAAFTGSLINSDKPEDKAELQWRLVTPVSTILLALLAVPLSRSGPRQGKIAAAPVAIAVFAIYYNMAALMKKWVAQGILGWLPGIWWSQIFLLVLFFIFMRRSSLFSSS